MRTEIQRETAFNETDLHRTTDENFFITRFDSERIGDEVKAQCWGYLDKLDKISAFQYFISTPERIIDGKLVIHDARSGKYFLFSISEGKLYESLSFDVLDKLQKITNRLSRSQFVRAIEGKVVIITGREAEEMRNRFKLMSPDNFPRAVPSLLIRSDNIEYLNERIFGNQARGIAAEAGNLFIYQGSRLRVVGPSSIEVNDQLNRPLPSAPDLVLSEAVIQNVPMIQKYLLPRVPNFQGSEVPTIEGLLEAKADEFNFIGLEKKKFINALTTLKYLEQTQVVDLDNFSLDETSDQQRLALLFDFIMSQYEKINEGQAARSAITSHQINDKISIGIVDSIAESKFFEINFKTGRKDYKLQLQPDSLKYYKEGNTEVTNPEVKSLLNGSLADIIRDVSRSAPSAVAGPSSVARVAGDERFLGGN